MLNAPPSNPQRTPQRVERGKDPRSSALGFPPTAPQFPGPHGLPPGYPWRGRGWHGGTGETRGGHGGDRGTRWGAGTASGQERAREGSGGVGGWRGGYQLRPGGRPVRSRPSGLPGEGQRGMLPALPRRAAGLIHLLPSKRCREPQRGVTGRSPRQPPARRAASSRRWARPPRPGRPTRGTGGMRRGMYPSPTRPDLWVAWDFLSRCEGGDEVMVMGTLPDVSRLAGGCASSC